MNVAAQITLTPGTVISRLISAEHSASRAIWRSTAAISASRNSTWRMHPATVSASSTGSSSSPQPLAPLDAEQVSHRRAAHQPAHEHGVDLVLRPRPCAHQLLAPRQAPAQHPAALIRRSTPRRARPPHSSLRQRPRVQPVGLRPRLRIPVSAGSPPQPGDVRLEDSRDLPRVPRHLQRHPVRSLQARGQHLQRRRRPRDPTRRADRAILTTATSQKSRCTSNPIALPTDLLRHSCTTNRENQRANDNDRYVLTAHPGKSQGRPPSMLELEAHRPKRPTQPAFSRKAPVPVTDLSPARTNLRKAVSCPEQQPCRSARPRGIQCIGTTSTARELSVGSELEVVAIALRQREQRHVRDRVSCRRAARSGTVARLAGVAGLRLLSELPCRPCCWGGFSQWSTRCACRADRMVVSSTTPSRIGRDAAMKPSGRTRYRRSGRTPAQGVGSEVVRAVKPVRDVRARGLGTVGVQVHERQRLGVVPDGRQAQPDDPVVGPDGFIAASLPMRDGVVDETTMRSALHAHRVLH